MNSALGVLWSHKRKVPPLPCSALQEMLKDEVRTRTYMNSITMNKHIFKGKVSDSDDWVRRYAVS